MIVEQNDTGQLIIKVSSLPDASKEQLIGYVRYLEAASRSMASEDDANQLAEDLNAEWWSNNKNRFIR